MSLGFNVYKRKNIQNLEAKVKANQGGKSDGGFVTSRYSTQFSTIGNYYQDINLVKGVEKYVQDQFKKIYERIASPLDFYNIEKSLYMFFDYNKKLKSYYTDTGTQSSADVLTWENTFNKLDCENCSIGTVE